MLDFPKNLGGMIMGKPLHFFDFNTRRFLNTVLERCLRIGVHVDFPATEKVKYKEITCNGYFFDYPEPQFVVAVGKPRHEWLKIVVHEYAHLLQWEEGAKEWVDQAISPGLCALDLLFEWCEGEIELTYFGLADLVLRSREVERDCEIRALRLIHDFALPLDPRKYAQRANAYLYSYSILPLTRKWYVRAPHDIPEIWERMPMRILDKSAYMEAPEWYRVALTEQCY
jgi:hypothetical protein